MISAGAEALGLPLVVWYPALGGLGQVDSHPDWENPVGAQLKQLAGVQAVEGR